MIDLAELLRLEREATSEPWNVAVYDEICVDAGDVIRENGTYEVSLGGGAFSTCKRGSTVVFGGGVCGHENATLSASDADKAFIVALRNAFPALAAELTKLRERCEALRTALLDGGNVFSDHRRCTLCGFQWAKTENERHSPWCIAAPGAPDV